MARIYNVSSRKQSAFFSGLSVTSILIFCNLFFYIVSLFILTTYGQSFFSNNIALNPNLIIHGKSMWTFLTSMFSHTEFFHIFVNMFSLFFIGNFLEKIIGKKRFFLVYMAAGLIAGVFFVLSGLIFNDNLPGIGASGAIFGILGVLCVLVPNSKIYLIAGPLILIITQVVLNPFISLGFVSVFNIIINVLTFMMILSLFSFSEKMKKFAIPIKLPMWLLPFIAIIPLVVIDFFVDLPIGNSAHFGGLVVGLVYGFYLRYKFPNKTRMLSGHFS